MLPDTEMIRIGWHCLCPSCKKNSIFKPGFTMELKDTCEVCGLDITKNDSGDGPAVFLIFILGFSLVPMALWLDMLFPIPLWLHAVIWTIAALGLTIGTLRPLKAYVIALQYKYRKTDWD